MYGSSPIRSARRRGRTRYSPRVRAPRAPVEVREYAGRGEARVGEGGRGQGRPGGCLGHAVEDVFLRRVLVEDPVERELEVAHLHIVPGRVLAASITRWQALVLWLRAPGVNSTWMCRCSPALCLTSTSVPASPPGRSRAYTPMEVSFRSAGVARASTSRNSPPRSFVPTRRPARRGDTDRKRKCLHMPSTCAHAGAPCNHQAKWRGRGGIRAMQLHREMKPES